MTADVRSLPGAAREVDRTARAGRHLKDARDDAKIAALQTLSYLAEGQERAADIADLGDLLPPSVSDGMRRLAEHMKRETERMAFVLSNGGAFR